jgi:integrase
MNKLANLTDPNASPALPLSSLFERARQFKDNADAANTAKTYSVGWRHFLKWCEAQSPCLQAMPARPEIVALYLTAEAEHCKVATLRSRLSAINRAHREAGHETPGRSVVVQQVFKGIRRTKGVAPRQATPIVATELRAIVETIPDNTLGLRDRALLLLGFHGAFRRSELVALDVGDVAETKEGLRVLVRRSKTDQEGEGLEKGILFQADPSVCPVRALRAWKEAMGDSSGPLFRAVSRHGKVSLTRLTDRAVHLVVKRACNAAGLDTDKFSAHSLRSGLATQAAIDGCPERTIMRQGGWRGVQTVRGYIRHGSLFQENVGTYLRLAG